MSSVRVLVCGDVEGNFDQLFNRVRNIQKKSGPFECLFCVGEFFGKNCQWEKYLNKTESVPISTFILGANQEENLKYYQNSEDGELCPNVVYLGHHGIYTTCSGLQIAYLSGIENSTGSSSSHAEFTENDIKKLCSHAQDSAFNGVDILLTSQWGKGVEKYATSPEGLSSNETGSSLVSQLALLLKPRYHFSSLEKVFYERPPYRNHKVLQESTKHVTRFISLASVSNTSKKKYLYAFNLVPLNKVDNAELIKQPFDVTECPYTFMPLSNKKMKSSQFFYNLSEPKEKKRKTENSRRSHEKPSQPTGPCWFCLGSEEVEKHLVVSVGLKSYLALAKGGLVSDHALILPIFHHQSTNVCPEDVIQEIEQYKMALKKYFATKNKDVVFFERNYKTQHLQIQAIPFPKDLAQEAKEAFMNLAETENINLHEIPKHSDLKQIVPAGVTYFYAELPFGERFLHRIKQKFPLQFGREAMADATLLNMPERIDWRECKRSQEEETKNAKEFRKSFQPFDFNLD